LKLVPVERTRHYVLRLHEGDTLPETLLKQLRERRITGGWLHLTGVLTDVDLVAYSAELEGPGGTKRLNGKVQAVALDGSIGIADGGVALSLRAVLGRESDLGLETAAGQLVRARVIGLEGWMTSLEETVVPRSLDKSAGISLLRDDAIVSAPALAAVAGRSDAPVVAAAPPSAPDVTAPAASPVRPPGALRLPRPVEDAEDVPCPLAGDIAEHFAFGTCEVLKSDGDRLQVRMVRDGRISEIALEKLKVTVLPADGTTQRFRLSRKM
jgi:hypothetical protein